MLNKQFLLPGVLAASLLILFRLGRFAIWAHTDRIEWILAGGAVAMLAVGYGLRRLLPAPARPPEPPASSAPATRTDRPAEPGPTGLSEREFDVLQLMTEGLSNREIADRLFIAESTVKTHIANLFVKLNARRRTEAIQKARLRGLV